MKTSDLLTVTEVAKLLRTSPKAIYCKLYRNELPKAAIVQRCKRGRILFVRSVLERHLLSPSGRGGR